MRAAGTPVREFVNLGGSTMTLPREEVVPGLLVEFAEFGALVRSLDESELAAPSRCTGWSAGDVAGHVIGQTVDITAGRFEGLGTPEVTARQVEERRGRTPAELADELAAATKIAADILASFDDAAWAGPGPSGPGTLGDGVESLWFDAWLHADDIRAATGRPTEPGPAVRASVSHIASQLTEQDWRPATLSLDGVEEFVVAGGGPAVTGDAVQFVLVATGRGDPSVLELDETVNIYR
jgi:uncharacterized protein (TIGR03083 family)